MNTNIYIIMRVYVLCVFVAFDNPTGFLYWTDSVLGIVQRMNLRHDYYIEKFTQGNTGLNFIKTVTKVWKNLLKKITVYQGNLHRLLFFENSISILSQKS